MPNKKCKPNDAVDVKSNPRISIRFLLAKNCISHNDNHWQRTVELGLIYSFFLQGFLLNGKDMDLEQLLELYG